MPDQEEETPPENQSPETLEEVVDFDTALDQRLEDESFVGKLKEKLGLGASAEPPASGEVETPAETPEPAVEEGPPASGGPPASSPSVAEEVQRVLSDREHTAHHEELRKPPEPEEKPERKGLAAAVFGKKR